MKRHGSITIDKLSGVVSASVQQAARRSGRVKVGGVVVWEQRPRDPSEAVFRRRILRLREIERVIKSRHGQFIPETDDGDLFIKAAAFALNAHCAGDCELMLAQWCRRYAPWALIRAAAVIRPILNGLVGRKYDLNADKVAALLNVGYRERLALKLNTIGAADCPPVLRRKIAKNKKRQQDRERQAAKRLRQGRRPQKFSASQQKPWVAEGISRRTWYRRRGTVLSLVGVSFSKHGDKAVPSSPLAISTDASRSNRSDGPHGPKTSLTLGEKKTLPLALGCTSPILAAAVLVVTPFPPGLFNGSFGADGGTEPLDVDHTRMAMGLATGQRQKMAEGIA